jgi:hypothetical protein
MPIAMPRRSRTAADRAAIRTEVTDRLTALGQPAVVV